MHGSRGIHDIDVLILAECAIPAAKMLTTLKSASAGFTRPPSQCKAVHVYTRFSGAFLTPVVESVRISVQRLHLPAREEVLLAMPHLRARHTVRKPGRRWRPPVT